MRVRVRNSFKVARANAKGASVVLGGKGYIALALLALVLAACSGGKASPSPAGTPPASSPGATGTSSAPSPGATGTSATTAPNGTNLSWTCVTTSPTGTCPRGSDYTTGSTNTNGYNAYVANNCWGDPGCKQTLSANSFGDWQVTANEPAGNGSVRTAPEAQQQFNNWCPGNKTWSNLVTNGCPAPTDTPLSAMSQLTSTYAESTPHNSQTIAQWAWDNWLSNDSGYASEVMVWVDVNGRCNSGSFGNQVHAPVTIAGKTWTPHRYPNSTEFIWTLDGSGTGTCAQQASGTVDLLALLKWMQANGFAAPGATLSLVDGTFEICSTGGVPETFRVFSYSVKAAAA